MPKIRAIVFDHYGTLADIRTNEEKGEIFRCLSLYLQYYGAHISERTLKSSLGLEKQRYLKAKKQDNSKKAPTARPLLVRIMLQAFQTSKPRTIPALPRCSASSEGNEE
jgi:FMN phosphatase YigB (HAD superfamily)